MKTAKIILAIIAVFCVATEAYADVPESPKNSSIDLFGNFIQESSFCLAIEIQDGNAFVQVFEKQEGPVNKVIAGFDLNKNRLEYIKVIGSPGADKEKIRAFCQAISDKFSSAYPLEIHMQVIAKQESGR